MYSVYRDTLEIRQFFLATSFVRAMYLRCIFDCHIIFLLNRYKKNKFFNTKVQSYISMYINLVVLWYLADPQSFKNCSMYLIACLKESPSFKSLKYSANKKNG